MKRHFMLNEAKGHASFFSDYLQFPRHLKYQSYLRQMMDQVFEQLEIPQRMIRVPQTNCYKNAVRNLRRNYNFVRTYCSESASS